MAEEKKITFGPLPEPSVERQKTLADKIVKDILERESIMHYRNGREARNGDKVIQLGNDGQVVAWGLLYGASASGGDYCNGNIAPTQNPMHYACLCDCLHVDDVAAMLKEKGLDKRPAGR